MNFIKEIFERTTIDTSKLIKYGFIKKDNNYIYKRKFMNHFEVIITIDDTLNIFGKIFDLNTNEEYTTYRIIEQNGEFVSKVREEYKNILMDIRENCFIKKYFIYPQSNRITNLIINTYHDEPEYAWEKSPGFGIFKNPINKKWYGLIMNIDKNKIDKNASGEIEAINVKLNKDKIPVLLKKKGYYEAYHMNKKNWVTIILDDTLTDEEIFSCIKESHEFTEK